MILIQAVSGHCTGRMLTQMWHFPPSRLLQCDSKHTRGDVRASAAAFAASGAAAAAAESAAAEGAASATSCSLPAPSSPEPA